jgi:hypothetical protein
LRNKQISICGSATGIKYCCCTVIKNFLIIHRKYPNFLEFIFTKKLA